MRVLGTVWAFFRLFAALSAVAAGLLWSRRWATRRFRRRLARQGISRREAAVLSQGYRSMVSLPLRELISNRGG